MSDVERHDSMDALLAEAREIWGDEPRMHFRDVLHALGVIHGDMCRIARDADEGRGFYMNGASKELGNVLVSIIRWMDDAGFNREQCIRDALDAQRRYVAQNTRSSPD